MRRLLAHAGILAWRDGGFRHIPDGYLGIDGAFIDYVGAEKPEAAYDEVKDLPGRLLIPGLVNGHCHAAMTLLRGVGGDLPLDRWLFEEIFPVEARLTPDDIRAGNRLAMMELLSGGVTSFTDMYMEAETLIELNETVGMKANVTRVVNALDPDQRPEDNPSVKSSFELFDRFHGAQDGRVRVDFCIHAEYTITEPVARYYAERMLERRADGARIHLHLSETEKEQRECVQRHGMTPAAWFDKLGVFDVPAVAAHCTWCDEADLRILLARGVSPVHNPTSNMKLGSGFAPVPRMLELGLNVGLGTDGAASNNNLNLFEEMHLAAILHDGYTRNPVLMPPEQVLRMATVNGARLQGREDTGRLEAGCRADVAAVDLRRPHLYPCFDPVALLVYSAQASDVCMTMVDGRILYENGRFMTIDAEQAMAEARRAVDRLYGGR